MTRQDLAERVQQEVGLSRNESAWLVERLLLHICHALSSGEGVKIAGFGTFALRDKPERPGRNPSTGEEAVVTARRVLTFRASEKLKLRLLSD